VWLSWKKNDEVGARFNVIQTLAEGTDEKIQL
jgi:hypothetical protein